ncbi:MAG: ABC transporter permease subunit [Candidatus Nanopelagicales bacterium]|nr:ABC transporter permease subunit [Candidatus Nanopelagicales bacterium]
MQSWIARMGGTPALVIKIIFLGVLNAAAIWAIPAILANEAWPMLIIIVLATAGLDFIFLTKRFIPAKYVIIGATLLTIFQLIPIGYTVSVAFTNYSTGHIGTKQEAVTAIQRDALSEGDNAQQYDMLPAYNESQSLVAILTEVPKDAGTAPDATASTEPDAGVQTDFGPGTDTGAAPSSSTGSDLTSGTNDLNTTGVADAGSLPPTYIGTPQGLNLVPPSDVERDASGAVIGVAGYAVVPASDLPAIDADLNQIRIPGPNGGFITPQSFTTATELTPVVIYDPATDSFTNVQTGVVYTDNGKGSFTDPNNPDDELLPGWKTGVGLKNFTSIVTDPDIRGPFGFVFLWTFAYALLTVVLTFFIGLGLAMTLNKPGMKGQRTYRSMLILPYAVPAFLSVLVWAGLLNDDFGALNSMFHTTIPWLFDPTWAKVSCLLVNLWLGIPYMFLISTGALQAIPSEMQEAARVDGARQWQVFRLVNLPLLLIALTPLLVASFAFNFNNFNNIYLLTGGGPAVEGSSVAGATDILISYTYKIAFAAGKGNDYGLASAISIIIFLIVGTISAISFARSKALQEERT